MNYLNKDKRHGFLYPWEADKKLASAVLRGQPHGEVREKHSGTSKIVSGEEVGGW